MALRAYQPESSDFRGLSLCAGYGGLDLGLHIAEPAYRTVGFVEREAHAAATLVARMGDQALDPAPVWDDLRSFDGRPWRGRVHLIAAGYPCQPFSLAGNRLGAEDPRHLWPEVYRIVREVEPEWLFFENVAGHLTLGFADVLTDLRGLGFEVAAGLFTAEEVGASHVRTRLFVVAYANRARQRLLSGCGDSGGEAEVHRPLRRGQGEQRPIQYEHRQSGLDDDLDDAAVAGVDAGKALPLFAPGPAELEDWSRILDRRPDLQPGLLRTGDGMDGRLDRTAAVGNGVCSVAAALAWSTLKGDLQLRAGVI